MAKQITRRDLQYRGALKSAGITRVTPTSTTPGNPRANSVVNKAGRAISLFAEKKNPIPKPKQYRPGVQAANYSFKKNFVTPAQQRQYIEYQRYLEAKRRAAPTRLSVAEQARLHEFQLRRGAGTLKSDARSVETAARMHESFLRYNAK